MEFEIPLILMLLKLLWVYFPPNFRKY